jgi:hypothetical protein
VDHLGLNTLRIDADSQKHGLQVSGYDPVTRNIQTISCIDASYNDNSHIMSKRYFERVGSLYQVLHWSSVD